MATKKRETNEQIIKRLMNFGPFGAMQQMFIIDAITKAAANFQKMTPEEMAELGKKYQNSLVDMESWAKCGKYLGDELDKHYKQ